MSSSTTTDTIPAGVAYTLIGLITLLVAIACAGLVLWQQGWLNPNANRTAAVATHVADNTAHIDDVSSDAVSAPELADTSAVDNQALVQHFNQCNPNCARVNLAGLNMGKAPMHFENVNLSNANFFGFP